MPEEEYAGLAVATVAELFQESVHVYYVIYGEWVDVSDVEIEEDGLCPAEIALCQLQQDADHLTAA